MRKAVHKDVASNGGLSPKWSLYLWLAAATTLVLMLTIISTAWAVRHVMLSGFNVRLSRAQAGFVMWIAEFPGLVRETAVQVRYRFDPEPTPLLLAREATEKSNWIRHFPEPADPGFLLLAAVDPSTKRANVRLIRIADDALLARWAPDWQAVYKMGTSKRFAPLGDPARGKAWHPLLLPDGDIIFNANSRLFRQSSCSARPVWVLDEPTHHSIELDPDGDIWVPSVALDGLAESAWLSARVQDDALAKVSSQGNLLERRSFSNILRNNGLQTLLLGITGGTIGNDPIHLNQIQIATHNSKYWRVGDLLISARHLSTVFLYRPSTNKVLWHQTGPWMNQHSVDFVNDHQISVFDNNVIAGVPKEHAFLTSGEINRVYLFDFENGQLSQPYAGLLAQARPVTITDGRARVLPDGGLFLEETNSGRHLRFTRDRLLWSRVNDYDETRIGIISWSRYLTVEEVRGPLQALALKNCGQGELPP